MNDINSVFKKFEKDNPEIKEMIESEEYKLSRVISEARIEMGYTQRQFANLCKVSEQTIHRLEGADKGIDSESIKKVITTIDALKSN